MSRVSKSIFVLERTTSQILYDYIDLCFFDVKTFKTRTNLLCCCCDDDYEYVRSFSEKDMFFKDKLTHWVYELSLSYIRQSGIDCSKLHLSFIDCIKSGNQITIKNTNAYATVIFHFNDKNDGYVTTHQTNNLNYIADDRKYIVVVYERL